MKPTLYLGSYSRSRQELLHEAQIPFHVLGHDADESRCNFDQPFSDVLKHIAKEKMNHVLLPNGQENEIIFVLTADTMAQDQHGKIHGKPKDRTDAIAIINALRGNGLVGTAFCLERKLYKKGSWQTNECIINYVETSYEFDMPDAWIEHYLKAVPYFMELSGGVTIQGFGAQFLKRIDGSYTNIIGLPMFEVREALEKLGW